MPIKSLDLVTSIPRLAEVAKVQQAKQQEGEVARQQFAAQLQNRVEHQRQQVKLPPRSEKVEQGREEQRHQGGKRRRPREKEAGDEPGKQVAEPEKGRYIDITLGECP
ncbi:MAG: hypothetical protein AB1331_00540 [Bacillota bacterium]